MSTNLELVTDALRSLGVLDETETPSAEQGSHCLRQMNQMLAEWAVDGIDLGYFAQSSTADTSPIPDWAEGGVSGKLAMRVARDYGAQVSAELAARTDEAYSLILRTLTNQRLQGLDMSHLPQGSGGFGSGYNILTG